MTSGALFAAETLHDAWMWAAAIVLVVAYCCWITCKLTIALAPVFERAERLGAWWGKIVRLGVVLFSAVIILAVAKTSTALIDDAAAAAKLASTCPASAGTSPGPVSLK